jgi:NADPH-dependent curcumin reductase CurA
MIKESNFRWNETQVPAVGDGQVLVRNLVLSFDPTQRGWMSMDTYVPMIPIDQPMRGFAAGQVVESKNPSFSKGQLVQGILGWEDYTLKAETRGLMGLQKLPSTDPILGLSLLGATGLTAYFGTLAAGATGSVAGMIAKLKGCRVIGIAGGAAKCAWLVKEAGFDGAIDYKNEKISEALKTHCPKGVDVYFDNVGGDILDRVLARIANGARVVLCGAISQYNEPGMIGAGPKNYFNLIPHSARMEGFLVFQFAKQYPQAIADLTNWHAEGKIKNQIDLVEGLEAAPKAIVRLFTGGNLGKQMLHLGDPQ